jgi:hypothetical protein
MLLDKRFLHEEIRQCWKGQRWSTVRSLLDRDAEKRPSIQAVVDVFRDFHN